MKLLMETWRKYLSEESSTPPKAIFMAGSPGAGKSTVINRMNLDDMEIINPDDFYEPALEKAGLGKNIKKIKDDYTEARERLRNVVFRILNFEMGEEKIDHDTLMQMYAQALELDPSEELSSAKAQYDPEREKIVKQAKLFAQAQKSAKAKQAQISDEGKSFIIDGTGGAFARIRNQKKALEEMGYETGMIFVDIPLEDAIARQEKRLQAGGRALEPKAIEKSWTAVQKNKDPYSELFGDSFFLVSAREEDMDDSVQGVRPMLSKFLSGQELNEADWQKWVRANYKKQVGAYTRGGKNKVKPTGWKDAPIGYRGSAPPNAPGG